MTDVKSTIYQRGDGQMIVTTGPTTCCFGSKRIAAEFIAMYQEELLLTKQRLAAAEAERIWTCGCGIVNGVNLATCRVCGRKEGDI